MQNPCPGSAFESWKLSKLCLGIGDLVGKVQSVETKTDCMLSPRRMQLYNEMQQHPEQLQEAVAALDTDGSNLTERWGERQICPVAIKLSAEDMV